jgi:PAS domain S-box-containing protein
MPIRNTRRDKLGRALTSDVFVFEEPDRIYRTLKFILVSMVAAAAAIAVMALIIGWSTPFRIAAAAAVSFFLVILLLRMGYPRMAGILMPLALTSSGAYAIYSGDGIHDIAIVIFPMAILVGSFLLSTRFYAVLTLVVIACVAIIGHLEITGAIKNKFSGMFGYPDLYFLSVILAAAAVVIRLLGSVIVSSIQRAYRSERSYREVFNATSEAILIHDATTGAIIDVNDSTLFMFGYEREEMSQMMPEDLTPDSFKLDKEKRLQLLGAAIRGGETQVFEWLMVRKDGREFWAEVTLRGAEISGEKRLLGVIRNVESRKRMEERLRQSEKMEAVGQLAGGIAHDFNNQLAGIVGFADLVRSEMKDDAELADSVDRILVAARRAADLTTQLLAFARKGKYESAAVDMHQLVDEVISLLRHSVDKRITIEQVLEADPPLTLGDPSQLQSAILNLAINACDAMAGGGNLTFATKTLDLEEADETRARGNIPPGRYIQISVSDTGTGIDAETQRHIFEPFFTTKEKGRGTGMGLAAVYGTVRNHGGAIPFDSEPGRGSTFRVLLPHYDGPVIPDERAAEWPAEVNGSARVLVVDDEETVCNVAARMLEQMGCEAVLRCDGVAALEYYRESWRDVDLVILDMAMPRMGGRETFVAMREVNPATAVLLTSGFSINDEVQSLLDAGACGFLQKPFWKKEFTSLVVEALKSSPQAGAGIATPDPDSLQ